MDTIAQFYGSSSSSDDDGSGCEQEALEPMSSGIGGDSSSALRGVQSPHSSPLSRKRSRDDNKQLLPVWKRAFAHVDGNWPSHVRVDIPMDGDVERITNRFIENAKSIVGGNVKLVPMAVAGGDGGGGDEPSVLHLSLSRPFVVTYDQIDAFVGALRSALKWRTRFSVALDRALVLVNDDRTRSFLALQVEEKGTQNVISLLHCVDKCMRAFGLQTYYADPIPHVSIASALGDSLQGALSTAQLDQLHREQQEDDDDGARAIVRVSVVQVVIGNKQFRIPLR